MIMMMMDPITMETLEFGKGKVPTTTIKVSLRTLCNLIQPAGCLCYTIHMGTRRYLRIYHFTSCITISLLVVLLRLGVR